MNTHWRSLKTLLTQRNFAVINSPELDNFYECSECGFVFECEDTSLLTDCPNCLDSFNNNGNSEDAEILYEVLNDPTDVDPSILIAEEPVDLLHDSCDCPTYDINASNSIKFTSCEYTEDIRDEETLAPICPVCDGCIYCRYYITDNNYDPYN